LKKDGTPDKRFKENKENKDAKQPVLKKTELQTNVLKKIKIKIIKNQKKRHEFVAFFIHQYSYCYALAFLFSNIFLKERPRISSNVNPVAKTSSSVIAPLFKARRK